MEIFSALLAICAENSPLISEFPTKMPVTRSFNVFFDLHLKKRFSKQSWGWWFEMPSCPLWRHSNEHRNSSFVRAIHQTVPMSWRHYGKMYRRATNWISLFPPSSINWSYFICLTIGFVNEFGTYVLYLYIYIYIYIRKYSVLKEILLDRTLL